MCELRLIGSEISSRVIGGRTRSAPKSTFAAHMDHPGWVRAKNGKLHFLGSVAKQYLVHPRMKEFGDFAMWDLPAFEFRNEQIYSRACDDLLGCAAIIYLFRELEANQVDVHCAGLFTRAEDVGFVGAIKLAQSKMLSDQTTIFSLETSTPRGSARRLGVTTVLSDSHTADPSALLRKKLEKNARSFRPLYRRLR
jgi:hypothetical protein